MRIFPLSSRAWLIVPLCACGFLAWINTARIRHVQYVSAIAGETPPVDAASPTGYAGGLRQLIVPEHNNDSYQWIVQAQELLSRGKWHLRHVDYDNAPFGREVRSPSPYRWWLGLCAWLDHLRSGRPPTLSVERAALVADPALQLLFLIGAVAFAVWQFGFFPAALLSAGMAAIFPLAGEFLPGQPNDHGLSQACAVWSVLLLLAGIAGPAVASKDDVAAEPGAARARRRRFWWFFAGGIAGGAGLWISVARQAPVLAGIALGGIFAGWLAGRTPGESGIGATAAAAWRVWGLGGAVMTLAASVIEYFPAQMGSWRLETIHPLYGLAWLGAGETLVWMARAERGPTAGGRWRTIAAIAIAGIAVAVVPAALLLLNSRGLLADNGSPERLTNLPGSPEARNLWAWVRQDGVTAAVWTTLLPLLWLGPAAWRLVRRATEAAQRAGIALAAGPVVLALVLACFQLRAWNLLDAMLLALLIVIAPRSPMNSLRTRWLWLAGVAATLTPGMILLASQVAPAVRETVTESELEGLLERDLARWLANQAGSGGGVVLAPLNLTASLHFYAGLRGLGTPYWENKAGFTAAVRIAGASTPDEAQAVARGRGLTHIVIPSWDSFLDEYARLGSNQTEHSLIALLHRWLPPRWLRPVPFRLPRISGFEDQSVAIFAVVDVQDNASALSRLAEYFVEMEQLDQAASVSDALGRFYPADLGAAIARALVEQARGDAAGSADTMTQIESDLARGDDRALPWDRRVSLAIALFQAKRGDQAREQVRRCLAEVDEPRLRSLTTAPLYQLQLLAKVFGFGIADSRLGPLARQLLPEEMRARL